jgi:hypothetical protein
MRRSAEVENVGIADVQRYDLVALRNNLISDGGQIADGITNVVEARGGSDFAILSDGHE